MRKFPIQHLTVETVNEVARIVLSLPPVGRQEGVGSGYAEPNDARLIQMEEGNQDAPTADDNLAFPSTLILFIVLAIVHHKMGKKMVVLYQNIPPLEQCAEVMKLLDFTHRVITGNTSPARRQEIANEFNMPYSGVTAVLAMSKSGGTGFDFIAADMLVHMQSTWRLTEVKQGDGRIKRIGQTK